MFDFIHEEEIVDDKLGRAWSPRPIGSDGAERQNFDFYCVYEAIISGSVGCLADAFVSVEQLPNLPLVIHNRLARLAGNGQSGGGMERSV